MPGWEGLRGWWLTGHPGEEAQVVTAPRLWESLLPGSCRRDDRTGLHSLSKSISGSEMER